MPLADRLADVRARLLKIADGLEPLVPLLARLSLAAVFVTTGWGKLHDLDKVTSYFETLGLPAPHAQAILVATLEFTCGSLILVGLLTRFAAAPLCVTMTVAILTAKRDDISGVADLFSLEEFIYIVLLVSLVLRGAGALSLDHLIARKLFPATAPTPKREQA
jgi:putative oxidoreductase